MTGTLTSGYLGLLDLTLNSTFRPRGISNPCGNTSMAMNDLPGCVSLICASTPGTLTTGSDNCTAFVLLFWIVTEFVTAFTSGPACTVM